MEYRPEKDYDLPCIDLVSLIFGTHLVLSVQFPY